MAPQNFDDLTHFQDERKYLAQQRALLRAAVDCRALAIGVLMERYNLTTLKSALLLAKVSSRSRVPVEAIAARVVSTAGIGRFATPTC